MSKYDKRESQLVGGNVPAGKPCPYKEECAIASGCNREKYMQNQMSCGAARAYDMNYRMK